MSKPSTPSAASAPTPAVAVATPTKKRRGALTTANRHWTDALAESEHATTRLGARFHLRKLFLRAGVDEFSQSELEFIVQYLVNETTVAEQPWWAALTTLEQLEIVNMLELRHVVKGDEHTLWFSSKETSKDCILLYGKAEAKPLDPQFAPLLKFTEGSVVGNMRVPSSSLMSGAGVATQSDRAINARRGSTDALPNVTVSAHASPDTWRRVKREMAFRNSIHFYNKLRIVGPADYFVLSSTDIAQTTAKAAERLERAQLLQLYGLERFLGCVRRKVFESGALLAREDEQLPALYFIVKGECRASVRVDDLVEVNPFAEKSNAADTSAADAMLHADRSPRRVKELPIASLGPRSLVGDASMLLGLREPATIQAVTSVVVLALGQEDYAKEAGDMKDPVTAAPIEGLKKVAFDTIGFVLDRVKAEAAYNHCDQTKKIRSMENTIAEKRSEFETPLSRHLLEIASWTRAAPFRAIATRGSTYSLSANNGVRPRSSSRQVSKIPTVVQKYMETVSTRKKSPRSALAPVILSKRRDVTATDENSPTRLTREQRKAALALSGLHSPLARKSLGSQLWQSPLSGAGRNRREEDADEDFEEISNKSVVDETDSVSSQPQQLIQDQQRRPRSIVDDDHLFLFPTMTRQRQLHARSLPLLPKYRASEANNR